jgi:tetratricopeptide (TPR) repeat protein
MDAQCRPGAAPVVLHFPKAKQNSLRRLSKRGRIRQPSPVPELFESALAKHRAGELAEAAAHYQRILFLDPDHVDAHNNLGVALVAQGRLDDAIWHYRKAIALNPGNFHAHNNLGTALGAQGRTAAAIAHYRSAIALNPASAASHYNLGTALDTEGRGDEAIEHYRRALSLHPEYAEAHNNLGNLLAMKGLTDQALEHYRRAIEIDPAHVNAHNNAGNLLRDQGRFPQAMAHYDRALEIRPTHAEAHFHRAEIKTFRAEDPDLRVLDALTRTQPPSPYLHFALAKALEDAGDYPRSFHHMRKGNTLRRSQLAYDEAGDADLFQSIAEVFDHDLLERLRGSGDPSAAPVFIVGMPRSGSTLIEHILASHPLVYGAGEREDLAEVAGPHFPASVPQSDSAALLRMGQDYLRRLPSAPGKLRIVDKLPANFLRIGLIRLILPNARIIHTVRHPLDTCISCYSKLFTSGQHFSYDLEELGRYYKRYEQLMNHWSRVLPADALLQVRYEDVVDDLEGQAKRLVAYCGLPWDEQCLKFHESNRPVRTASSVQVRQPLFRSSLQRWRRFEADLDPLIRLLMP